MIILKAFIAMFDMYVARNCLIIIKSRKTQKDCQTSALFSLLFWEIFSHSFIKYAVTHIRSSSDSELSQVISELSLTNLIWAQLFKTSLA